MNTTPMPTTIDTQDEAGVPPAPPATHQEAAGEDQDNIAGSAQPGMTATYSPDDNKLRLYSVQRLSPVLFERVKAAGFAWTPRQELFVAPAWTPDREDLLIELCGQIDDEDTTLVERAGDRAERFGDYQGRRSQEATAAHAAVRRITDGIPLGQPILIGHHSERRARKDAERIQDGMRRAVRLWETAEYWKDRAEGALRHAKHKESPQVRARRIKTLEADSRAYQRNQTESARLLAAWSVAELSRERALQIANHDSLSFSFPLAKYPRVPGATPYEGPISIWGALRDQIVDAAQAQALCVPVHQCNIAWRQRWLDHLQNRLEYERTMLRAQGGELAQRLEPGQSLAVGGLVLIGKEWLTVLRINQRDGQTLSVTTNARYRRVRGVEEIQGYRAPSQEEATAAQARAKLPPLVNYPGEGFAHITQAQWDAIPKDYRGTRVVEATATQGAHRVRTAMGAYVLADRGGADWGKRHGCPFVYITDSKKTLPPAAPKASGQATGVQGASAAPVATPAAAEADEPRAVASVQPPAADTAVDPASPGTAGPGRQEFEAMRQQLHAGVQPVVAPQLFPTPAHVAARMVELAAPALGERVLEPSAGTANLLRALPGVVPFSPMRQTAVQVVAVERQAGLAHALRASGLAHEVHCADFLALQPGELGHFDVIVMNPPFSEPGMTAADVAHIEHARRFLAPGGRLVALCAAGPRQHERLKPQVLACGGLWQELPQDTFAEQGTRVRVVLLTLGAL